MKKLLMITFLTVAAIAGCKKDESIPDPITQTQSKCSLVSITGMDDKTVNTYDSQNRVSKIEYFYKGKLDNSEVYTYTANSVNIKSYDATGKLTDDQSSETKNGYVTKSVDTYTETNNGLTTTYTDTYNFEYNAEGFLTKRTVEYKSKSNVSTEILTETISYTYSNGNLSQSLGFYKSYNGSTYDETHNYEYYTDKEGVNNLSSDPVDFGSGFLFGTQSKNLVKKVSGIYKDVVNGKTTNSTTIAEYTYDFDTIAKPSSVTEKYTDTFNGTTSTTTDKYALVLNCK